jgi:hypothetical protein
MNLKNIFLVSLLMFSVVSIGYALGNKNYGLAFEADSAEGTFVDKSEFENLLSSAVHVQEALEVIDSILVTSESIKTDLLRSSNTWSGTNTYINPIIADSIYAQSINSLKVNTEEIIVSSISVITSTGAFLINGTSQVKGYSLKISTAPDESITNFIVTKDGDVGINTDVPTSELDVNGVINANTGIFNEVQTSTITGISPLLIQGTNIIISTATNKSALPSIFVGGGNVGISTSSPKGLLHVGSGDTSKLIVETGGNVGIGITNPAAKLDIDMTDLTTTEGLHISRDAAGSHYAYFNVSDENDVSIFTIHESSRIIIGPGSASNLLHVTGDMNIEGNDGWDGAGDNAILRFGADVGSESGVVSEFGSGLTLSVFKSGGGGILGTNALDAMFVEETSGNVGISTSTPNVKLMVNGDYGATSTTPAQITSDQNNYAVSGFSIFRLSTDASRTITGLVAEDNKYLTIINVGANDLILANENASSTAVNRIITGTGGDVTYVTNAVAILWYDNISTRWRILK